MSFDNTLERDFPGALLESHFVAMTTSMLSPHGFEANNTLACVGVCRDEMCRSFENEICKTWGESMSMAGLGAMLFLGKTGMQAAQSHAPVAAGRARYLYFVFPHIGISPGGDIGVCPRPGLTKLSPVCGALSAYRAALHAGNMSTELSDDDLEQSLLRRRMNATPVASDPSPSLLSITRQAQATILEDLEKLLAATVTTDQADYAVFSGIQIHSGSTAYVQVNRQYAMISGQRLELG